MVAASAMSSGPRAEASVRELQSQRAIDHPSSLHAAALERDPTAMPPDPRSFPRGALRSGASPAGAWRSPLVSGAPRRRLQSDYDPSMRRRRTACIGTVAVAFAAVSLVLPAAAFAATAHFRYSHGEPLNDLRVTPGVTFHVGVATICRSGYATSVRDVPESEKNQVYAEYGITHHTTDQYEIDHLISLELGGSNAIGNLMARAE